MTEDIILTEDQRRKLDSIVQKMVANNESDEDIKFVVNDFKSIYGVKKKESTPSESESGSITSKSGWKFPTQESSNQESYFTQTFNKGFQKPTTKVAPEGSPKSIFEMDPGPQAPAQKTEFQKQKERMNKVLELEDWNKMTEEQKTETAKYNQDQTAWEAAKSKALDKGELFTFLDEDQKKEASLVANVNDASSKEQKYADIYNKTNDPSSRSLMMQSKYDKDMAIQKHKSYMTELYKSIDEQIAIKEKVLSSTPEGVETGATETLRSEIEALNKKKETFFKDKDAQIVQTYTEVAPEIKKFNVPGNTPQEKIENYAKLLREKAQKIWDENSDVFLRMAGNNYDYLKAKQNDALLNKNNTYDNITKKWEELGQIDQQLKAISPVVLINRTPEFDKSYGYLFEDAIKKGARLTKSFVRGLTGSYQNELSNPEERAQSFLGAINDANVIDYVTDSAKKLSEQQAQAPSMLSSEGMLSTVGTSLSMLPAIYAGTAILNTAKAIPLVAAGIDALAVTKYGRYLVNHSRATAAMLESNKVAAAIQAGAEMSIAGDISPKGSAAAEDANFMSGLIGKFGEQLAGGAINTLATSDAAGEMLTKMFGGASKEAKALITSLGQRVGGAIGETVQEYGESAGSLIKLYMEKGNWADIKKEIDNQFGTVDKNVEFAASSFIMGFTWGRTGLGKAAMDLYNKTRESLPSGDQAILDRFTNDVYRDVMDAEIVAKVEQIHKDPAAANYTPVTPQDLDKKDAALEIIQSTTATQAEKVEAARILAEINGRQKQEQVTKAAQALMSDGEQVQTPTEGETLVVTPDNKKSPVSNYVYRNGQWNKVTDNKTEAIDATEQKEVQEFYDSQNKSRISGQVRIGEESVQAQPVEGSSTQETSTSGNVQASEKTVNATNKILRESSTAQKSALGKMKEAVNQVAKSLGLNLEGKSDTRAMSEAYHAALNVEVGKRTKVQKDLIKAVDLARREGAAERVGKSLKKSGVKVDFVTSEQMAKESQGRGGEAGNEGVFFAEDGKILIDKDKFEEGWGSTVVWHEGTHPIINIIRNTNPKLYDAAIKGLQDAAKANPKSGIKDVIDWANENYGKDGKFTVNDETITETMARISDGKIDLDGIPKSSKQAIINFINKISKALGLGKVLNDTSDLETFRNLAKEISDVLTKGKDVAKVVGKENVQKYDGFVLGANGGQFSISSKNKTDKKPNKQKKVKRPFDESLIQYADIKEFDGKNAVAFLGDKQVVGDVKSPTGVKFNGRGGPFYPIWSNQQELKKLQEKTISIIKDGNVWATTDEDGANKLLNALKQGTMAAIGTQAPTGILGNKMMLEHYSMLLQNSIKSYDTIIKDKKSSPESVSKAEQDKISLMQAVNNPLKSSYNPGVTIGEKIITSFQKIEKAKDSSDAQKSDASKSLKIVQGGSFNSIQELYDVMYDLTYEVRSEYFKKVFNIGNSNKFDLPSIEGGKNYKYNQTILDYANDPVFESAEYGDIVGLLEYDPETLRIVKTVEEDEFHHKSYHYVIVGDIKAVKYFNNAIDARAIFYESKPSSEGEGVNPTPFGLRGKPQAARGIMGSMPSNKIDASKVVARQEIYEKGGIPQFSIGSRVVSEQEFKKRTNKASDKLLELFKRDNVPMSINEAKEIVKEVIDWADWYDGVYDYATDVFGEYADDFLSIVPLASMNSNSTVAVSLAINNIEKIYKGEKPAGIAEYYNYVTDFLEGKGIKSDKMSNFSKALAGDKNAIAVDMHVWSIIMGKDPNKKQVNPKNQKEFDRAKEFVMTLSNELGLAPREVQASLWAANFLRTGGTPDSYEEYIQKHVESRGLKEKIQGWRDKGYKPFSEVRKERELKNKPQASKGGRENLAPNGKPSKLNEKQYEQVRTPAFKKWFGDWENDPESASKVVDENGEPLVVYHGSSSPERFSEFDKDLSGGNFNNVGDPSGFYFGSNADYVYGYAKDKATKQRGTMYTAFLNIKNPVMAGPALIANAKKPQGKRKPYSDLKREEFAKFNPAVNDGYIADMGSYQNEYIAINPNQIKSATDNTGEFSTTDNRIQASKGGRENLAPNGKPSNLNEVQYKQVRTPEFKKWFGDWEKDPKNASKIVDENGEPKVMYTGTSKDKDFDKFNIPKNGAWFSGDPADASMYAETNDSQKTNYDRYSGAYTDVNTRPRVIPVFLNVRRPENYKDVTTQEQRDKINYSPSYKKLQALYFQNIYFDKEIGKRTDGIYKDNMSTVIILEDPNQIKSAIGNSGKFSPTDNKIQASKAGGRGETAVVNGVEEKVKPLPGGIDIVDGFYSPLEKKIVEFKQPNASANKWKEILGTKSDEAQFSGLADWLSSKRPDEQVKKDEIQKFIKDNRIEIKEIVKTNEGEKRVAEIEAEVEELTEERNRLSDYDEDYSDEIKEITFQIVTLNNEKRKLDRSSNKTKYEGYVLAGNKEGYKETLVVLPNPEVSNPEKIQEITDNDPLYNEYAKKRDAANAVNMDPNSTYEDRKKASEDYFKYAELASERVTEIAGEYQLKKKRDSDYTSSHWDEKDILVHTRTDVRYDSNGNKVLFIEEVQSDWGQEGKKEGFSGERKEILNNERNKIIKEWRSTSSALSKEEKEKLNQLESKSYVTDKEYDEMKVLRKKVIEGQNSAEKRLAELNIALGVDEQRAHTQYFPPKIPTAPYVQKTNAWTKLGLKIALKEAVAAGAKSIAWTTGKQQIERFDLRKSVDTISYKKNPDGKYDIIASKEGVRVGNNLRSATLKDIEGALGVDVANRIAANEGRDSLVKYMQKDLTGEQLSVGGTGMIGYYGDETKPGIIGETAIALVEELTGKKGEISEVKLKTRGDQDYSLVKNTQDIKDYSKKGYNFTFNGVAKTKIEAYEIVERGGQLEAWIAYDSTQASIEITSALKASVKQGMPQFSKGGRENLAPNGKPSNLTDFQYKQVRTPEFKKWFGDWEKDPVSASKVLDENGEPKVTSHVSKKKDIDIFDPYYKTELSSMGYHFGTEEQAKKRQGQYDFFSKSPEIGQYYLNINNPVRVSHMGSYSSDHIVDDLMDQGIMEYEQYEAIQAETNYHDIETGDAIVALLKEQGYDGLVYENEKEGEGDSYVPFDPNQIKSATKNTGAFSYDSNKVQESRGGRNLDTGIEYNKSEDITSLKKAINNGLGKEVKLSKNDVKALSGLELTVFSPSTVDNVNTNVPIIIIKKRGHPWDTVAEAVEYLNSSDSESYDTLSDYFEIVDGRHRIKKAISSGTGLNAVVVTEMDYEKYTGAQLFSDRANTRQVQEAIDYVYDNIAEVDTLEEAINALKEDNQKLKTGRYLNEENAAYLETLTEESMFRNYEEGNPQSTFAKAIDLFYQIRNTEGATKKRRLAEERKALMDANPSVKYIDDNIKNILDQLEKNNKATRKGNCP